VDAQTTVTALDTVEMGGSIVASLASQYVAVKFGVVVEAVADLREHVDG
jgi:hypothetical protein